MLCSRIAFEAIGSNSKDRMQSQPPPPSGQLSTTEQLQKYILQLTAYISDNNVKYNKNMNTLQEYYKQQHEALLNDNELLEEEQLALRNELAAHKDLLANKDRQTEEAEEMLESEKKENQALRSKLAQQRQLIDGLYRQLEEAKTVCFEEKERCSRMTVQWENEKGDLLVRLKEKEGEISRLSKDVDRVGEQLQERYSLPERVNQLLRETERFKAQSEMLSTRNKELQRKGDLQDAELERLRKQNQQLRSTSSKTVAENNLQQLQFQNKLRDKHESQLKQLETEHSIALLESNELKMTVKQLNNEINQLETLRLDEQRMRTQIEAELQQSSAEKESYLEEFRKLKGEYETVITRLEGSAMAYQKSNWALEQENKDLNDQLQGLQQLLKEIKAMNALQMNKDQYRKWAQIENAVRLQSSSKTVPAKPKAEQPADPHGLSDDWQTLLSQIEQLQI